jgi:hypothetical protein
MNLLKLANPITVTKGAFGLAGTAVGLVDTMRRETAHLVVSGLRELGKLGEEPTGPSDSSERSEGVSADRADVTGPTTAAAAAAAVTGVEGAPKGPDIVPVEPHAPAEPPIDVVGQALAAEAALEDGQGPDGAGMAHEPRGASRDEEHGEAALQRAEVDEIDEEVTAVLEGDVEPEEHLTEPLLDPADAKALAAEMQTMAQAADPHKG